MNVLAAVEFRDAPDAPGVYCFLGARGELLYVGKATSLRARLRQHASRQPGPREVRAAVLYDSVAAVRWEVLADEATACAREADLIVALQPPFNASYVDEGRWNYVVVSEVADGRLEFRLSPALDGGRAYGCFPHLGKGVSSRPGIACSDGYTALLRLLWAASAPARAHVPAKLSRSAPDEFSTAVDGALRPALHAFLSGASARLLQLLAEPAEPYLAPALARDRIAAQAFFAAGPRAVRRLRLDNGLRPGPVSRDDITSILAADLNARLGR